MKHMSIQLQLYILFISNTILALLVHYEPILALPLIFSIILTIYTIHKITKELILINHLIDTIKFNKIKGRFKTNNFNFIKKFEKKTISLKI